MEKLWTENLRKIEPYVPGEQSEDRDIIKLNANENPYPPSPMAEQAIKAALSDYYTRQGIDPLPIVGDIGECEACHLHE